MNREELRKRFEEIPKLDRGYREVLSCVTGADELIRIPKHPEHDERIELKLDALMEYLTDKELRDQENLPLRDASGRVIISGGNTY